MRKLVKISTLGHYRAILLISIICTSCIFTSDKSFVYQVRVLSKEVGDEIEGAKISIEVSGIAPLIQNTDSAGRAIMQIDASRAEQLAKLIVEADGYKTYFLNINLTSDALPTTISLEKAPSITESDTRSFSPIITLQEQPYHIGDVQFTLVFDNSGDLSDIIFFDHPEPQPNPFISYFELQSIPSLVQLNLTARHVDPDEVGSPIKIQVNGNRCEVLLNRYFAEETMQPKSVSIQLESQCFNEGSNSLSIFVEETKLEDNSEITNIDDIEFWDVYLVAQ